MLISFRSFRASGVVVTTLAALLAASVSGCTAEHGIPAASSPTAPGQAGRTPDAKPRPPRQDGSPGDILVAGRPVTGSKRSGIAKAPFKRTYTEGELYAAVTGYRSLAFGADQLEFLLADDIEAGKDVATTIDPAVQRAAYDGLRGRRGAAIVLDARTGDILGQVSTPSYDPGTFSGNSVADQRAWGRLTGDGDKPLSNRALRLVDNPGSAIHVLVAAAALEKGLLPSVDTPTRSPAVYAAPGSTTRFSGDPAHCTDATLRAALRYGCANVFARIASDLGADALASTAQKFGFNNDTLDTPVRAFESTWPRKPGNPTRLALMANGLFEVKSTPVQMAMVMAVLANGGNRVHPHLVTGSGTVVPAQRVVTRRTADQLRSALGDSFATWVPSASAVWALSATRTSAGRPVAIAVYLSASADATSQAGKVAERISAATRK
ncbi:penicillin-binding transpeptidase domain-containing protein [Streptomyces sp. NPDC005435]|uniref:penicillin-binding transpeptidase domain-containing protein n=1 Tax=Streptomyces sp. NPDC005435 TaxID=3154464 RepID=UPI0034555295